MGWLISDSLMRDFENSRYSQGRAAESSVASCSDGEQSVQSSGSHTQLAYLSPDKMTVFSRLSRSGMTFKPLTESLGEDLLTWYREGFLARTSAAPGAAKESQEAGPACGVTWLESLAKYDRSTHSWKTVPCSLFGDSVPFSPTWPRWGMMRDGVVYRQEKPGHLTKGTVSGYLPTPMASDSRDRGNVSNTSIQRRIDIGKQVGLSMLFAKEPCPMCVEGMMGWPLGWTDLSPLGMGKTQEQPHWLGRY